MAVENAPPGSSELPASSHNADLDGPQPKDGSFNNLLSVQLSTPHRDTLRPGEKDKGVPVNGSDIGTDLLSRINELSLLSHNGKNTVYDIARENKNHLTLSTDSQLGLHPVNTKMDSGQGQTDSLGDVVTSSFLRMLNILSMSGYILTETEGGSRQCLKSDDDTSGTLSNGQVDTGVKTGQCMILSNPNGINSAPGNNTQIPLNETSPTTLTDSKLSLPSEAQIKDKQTLDNKEQNSLVYAQRDNPALKDFQTIKIGAASFATGIEEKNDRMLPESYYSIIPKGTTSVPASETQSPFNAASGKSILTNGIFSFVEDHSQDEGLIRKEQSKSSSPDKITAESKNVFFSIENKNGNHDGSLKLQMVHEPVKADRINDDIVATAKSGDASLKVSLEPEGVGKIDIELVLNRGVINAQINTSETIGKEFIEKNLHNIMSSLSNEGLNIGSFSVSLRNRQGEMKDDGSKEGLQVFRVKEAIQLPFAQPNMGMVNIFV